MCTFTCNFIVRHSVGAVTTRHSPDVSITIEYHGNVGGVDIATQAFLDVSCMPLEHNSTMDKLQAS